MNNDTLRVYAAGPFFNEKQLKTMQQIESVIEGLGMNLYRPRDGAASAKKLNKDIGAGKDPSSETRRQVFNDNVENIDRSHIVVALIDDRDVGTVFEIGYAFKAGIPVITYTNEGYGMNLMLAESTLAHCKGLEQLRLALSMYASQMDSGNIDAAAFDSKFKRANLAEGVQADKKMDLYQQDKTL